MKTTYSSRCQNILKYAEVILNVFREDVRDSKEGGRVGFETSSNLMSCKGSSVKYGEY